jgi:hypothetical protein
MKKQIFEFGDWQHKCPICGDPLPAHQTWPGARYHFCGKPDCVAAVKKLPFGDYISAQERQCDGFECNNFLPEGRYHRGSGKQYCSPECWLRCHGREPAKCECGCDTWFLCKIERIGDKPVFMSPRHAGAYYRNKRLAEACGSFKEVLDEYLTALRCAACRLPTVYRHHVQRLGIAYAELSLVGNDGKREPGPCGNHRILLEVKGGTFVFTRIPMCGHPAGLHRGKTDGGNSCCCSARSWRRPIASSGESAQ